MKLRNRIASWIGGKDLGGELSGLFSVNQGNAPRMDTRELIASYRTSPWLRGVVAKIADHMAAVPWELFVKTSGGKAVRSTALQTAGFAPRRELKKQYIKAGELAQVDSHPLLDMMAAPNPTMGGVSARKVSSVYFDLKGEIFWILEMNGLNVPTEIWPIPPDWVTRIPGEGGGGRFFEVMMGGKRILVPPENMIWIRDLNPSNPYGRGAGFGESLMDEIDTDEYAAKVAKNVFYNKARPDMIVALEGASQATLDNAQASFEQKFRGAHNAHRTMWTSGKLTFKELQQKFADLELMDLRTFEREAFNSVFGVPPEIMGLLESSNRATVREAITIFSKEVLVPRLEVERDELQHQLVPLYDDRLFLDYMNPVPEDDDFQLEAMTANPASATIGEWRDVQGLEDRGDIDNIHMVPMNLVTMKPGEETESLPTEPPELDDIDV